MGFNEAYLGSPPWDIGHPQREFVRLQESGEVKGRVIDLGCGTGENTIYFASLGHDALGVDSATLAIAKARKKALERGSSAVFMVADALSIPDLKESFDTATDCGLFHTFSDEERILYAKSVASLLRPKGRFFVLCFSDLEPGGWGPRRVSKPELTKAFSKGWHLDYVRKAEFESYVPGGTVQAYLASASVV